MEPKYSILMIDDDRISRRSIERLLRDRAEVIWADTESGALESLSQNSIDCVLLDYVIPGIDALSLLSKISSSGTPVIMLTGEGSEEVAVAAMKRGAYDYLRKSILSPDVLERAIHLAVERGNLQEQLKEQEQMLQYFFEIVSEHLMVRLECISKCVSAIQDSPAEEEKPYEEDVRCLRQTSNEMLEAVTRLLECSSGEQFLAGKERLEANSAMSPPEKG